mmetsp:Transcript_83270/g.166642  ORF Transcript_83270/g.166642 Transcript_83270/m.166642 type:complete len:131 (-) Transcript_83270:209-601(-)
MGLMHHRFEEYEQQHQSEALAAATQAATQAAQAAAAAAAAVAAGGLEQYQYLVVYPKHTTLRHRLHTTNRLFIDFVQYLLTIDHTLRPTAKEALRHPWLFSSDAEEEEQEKRQQEKEATLRRQQEEEGSS